MPTPAIAASLALAPAAVSWWTGRRLRTDDPALPELLLARQQRLSQVGAAATVGIVLFATGHSAWALPVLLLGLWIAAWPLRREIFGERLDFVAYLAWVARSFVGSAGFWIALSFAPAILLATPARWRPWAAVAAAAVLLAWQAAQRAIFLACHDAELLLDRPDLNSRLDAIDRRARTRAPRVVRFAPPGAHLVNAFALPAVGRGTVAFSRTLLELMTPDEIAAIYGHEVAHLEHFTPQRVRLMHAVSVLLVLLGCALPFVLRSPWAAGVFPVAVCVAMFLRVRHSQAEETASDRRAVELTGDAAALARALQKLHFHARVPRRWPHDMEKHATHPSLARRVKALADLQHELDGTTPEAPARAGDDVFGVRAHDGREGAVAAAATLPAVLRGTTAGSYVALTSDRVHWFEGAPAGTPAALDALQARAPRFHALAYADLVELRVHASGSARVLVARERTGRVTRTPIVADDFGPAQAALDMVDGALASSVSAADAWPLRARIGAVLVLLGAMAAGLTDATTALAALTLLAVPTRAAAAATGAAVLLRLALAVLDPAAGVEISVAAGAVYAALGVGAIALAVLRTRGMEHGDAALVDGRRSLVVIVLAACVALAAALLAGVAWRDGGAAALAARSSLPNLVVALGALGAALVAIAPRLARAGGVLAMFAAIGIAAAGLTSRRHVLGDITWHEARAVAGVGRTVPMGSWRFEVSPSGRLVALQRPVTRGMPVPDALSDGWDYEVGAPGSSEQRTVRALELAFLDDARLLALTRRGSSLVMRVEPTFAGDDPMPRPAVALPPMLAPVLTLQRATGRWAVAGTPEALATTPDSTDGTFAAEDEADEGAAVAEAAFASRTDTLLVARGRVGETAVTLQRWAVPGMARPLVPLADGGVLYASMRLEGTVSLPLLMALGRGPAWELWRLDARGARRRVATVGGMPSCGQPDARDDVLCTAQDGALVRLWRVDAAGRVHEAGAVPAGAWAPTTVDEGRTATWLGDRRQLAVVDATRRRGQRIAVDVGGVVMSARATPGGFIALRADDGGLHLGEYRLVR